MDTITITLISFGGFAALLFILFMNNYGETKPPPDIRDKYLNILKRNGWNYRIDEGSNVRNLWLEKDGRVLRFVMISKISDFRETSTEWQYVMRDMKRYDETFKTETAEESFNQLLNKYYGKI